MSGSKRNSYWDTCILLAHIKGEKHRPRELEGIREQVTLMERGNLVLVTSAITLTEILQSKLTDHHKDLLSKLYLNKSFQIIETHITIAWLASEIRDFYQQKHDMDGSLKLATPDAIHLATAIYAECPCFYTFDDGKCGNSLGLLSLNGSKIADKYTIDIERPPCATPSLDL